MPEAVNSNNSDSSLLGVQNPNAEIIDNTNKIASETTLKNKIDKKKTFVERWKTNRFWIIKGTYYFLHYTWVAVMAVGAFIAWLIAMLMV